MTTECPWCLPHGDSEIYDNASPETFCVDHLAEYEGLSLVELDRLFHDSYYDLV